MTLSTPDDGALEAKFEVLGRLKTYLLHVHPGVVWISMPLQAANKELIAERPGKVRKKWNAERLYPVDLKGIDVLCVGAPSEASSLAWPKPVVTFPEGDFVVAEQERQVRLDHPHLICGRN